MRIRGFVLLFLLLLPMHVSGQQSETTVAFKSDRLQKLAHQPASTVRNKVLDLLKTSNFNSKDHAGPVFPGGTGRVHRRYRTTIGGHYLVVTFPKPRHFELKRSKVTAIEVIVGLNNPKHADALFTIDPDGRVVEHSKYSGELATDLVKLISTLEKNLLEKRPVGREYFERDGILFDKDGHEVGRWGK